MVVEPFSLSLGREAQRSDSREMFSCLLMLLVGIPVGLGAFGLALMLTSRLVALLPGANAPGWLSTPLVIALTVGLIAGLVLSIMAAMWLVSWVAMRLLTSPVSLVIDDQGIHLYGRLPVHLSWDTPVRVILSHDPFEPSLQSRASWLESVSSGHHQPPRPSEDDRFAEHFTIRFEQGRQWVAIRTQREVTRARMREESANEIPLPMAWRRALTAPTVAVRWAALRAAPAPAGEGLLLAPHEFLAVLERLRPHADAFQVE